jgi:anaerobic ribonucleoside-triphosphate reductase activating protein
MTYTGYIYEELLSGADSENHWRDLLSNTDILVDGPYQKALRTLDTPFRGSKNQRVIDVKASMARGEIILLNF